MKKLTSIILSACTRFVAILLCAALPFLNTGCAQTEAYLSNPNTQGAILSLTNAALSYTQGNTVGTAVNLVQGATLLIRSAEPTSTTATAAAPAALGTSAYQAAALAGVSQPLAYAVGAAVTTMASQGATPAQALESAAGTLMASTGVPDAASPVAPPAKGPRGARGPSFGVRVSVTGRKP